MIDSTLIHPLSMLASEAWFEPDTAIKIGAFGGAILGSLCGVLGAMAGIFAPRGKAKGLVLGAMVLMVAVGLVSLVVGIVGVSIGQPYNVWFSFMLIGVILTTVTGSLIPVTNTRYREADQRRLDAESMRRS